MRLRTFVIYPSSTAHVCSRLMLLLLGRIMARRIPRLGLGMSKARYCGSPKLAREPCGARGRMRRVLRVVVMGVVVSAGMGMDVVMDTGKRMLL